MRGLSQAMLFLVFIGAALSVLFMEVSGVSQVLPTEDDYPIPTVYLPGNPGDEPLECQQIPQNLEAWGYQLDQREKALDERDKALEAEGERIESAWKKFEQDVAEYEENNLALKRRRDELDAIEAQLKADQEELEIKLQGLREEEARINAARLELESMKMKMHAWQDALQKRENEIYLAERFLYLLSTALVFAWVGFIIFVVRYLRSRGLGLNWFFRPSGDTSPRQQVEWGAQAPR